LSAVAFAASPTAAVNVEILRDPAEAVQARGAEMLEFLFHADAGETKFLADAMSTRDRAGTHSISEVSMSPAWMP
jgi:hypothetical protein